MLYLTVMCKFSASLSYHKGMNSIKIISGISKSLNYCVIFIVFTSFTNVAAGRGLETRALVLEGGHQDRMPTVKSSGQCPSPFFPVKYD